MAEQNIASAVAFKVKVSGTEIADTDMVGWTVEQDLGQPDMCSVTLRNETHTFSDKYKLGDPVEVTAGSGDERVFKGEINGMEPTYKANGENVMVLRAFNKLHRLTRVRKSKTYVKQSDKDIVGAVAGEHGLSPTCGDESSSPKHEHVYQHNQTDIEFLRVRAARIGYDVWVDDTTLYFDAPDPNKDSGLKLRYGEAGESSEEGAIFLKRFTPRMSSARVLEEVEVRGWDPVKKEEIVGTFKASNSSLGSKGAHSETKSAFGALKSYEVDHPIYSVDEAKKIAEAKVSEATMNYITGDGECRGTPGIKPGIVVTITVNPDNSGDRFNGKYMIVGATHRYSNTKIGDTGGYVTGFRVNRNAEGG
jgi:phage protein D